MKATLLIFGILSGELSTAIRAGEAVEKKLVKVVEDKFSGLEKYPQAGDAKVLGINYAQMIQNCRDNKKPEIQQASWSLLFWFSENGMLDGASAEGQCWVVGLLLEELGDKRFSELSQKIPKDSRRGGAVCVAFELGLTDFPTPEIVRKAMKEYPLTYEVLGLAEIVEEQREAK